MHQGNTIDTLCNTGDGVYIVDGNQHIVRWNKAAEALLAYSESEVLNRQCHRVLAGKTADGAPHCGPDCPVLRAAAAAPQKCFDLRTRTKEGNPIWLSVSIIASTVQSKTYAAHILRDVSRERRMESVLNRMLADLGVSHDGDGVRDGAADGEAPPARAALRAPGAPGLLSGREAEVLALMAEGLPTKSLARKLGISQFTARNHIQNILVKLGLHSKAQAVSYAFKKGILQTGIDA